MKLLRLSYKNLFSLGEGSIELAGRGLTLVTGYSNDEGSGNGSGKSNLANKSILYTMFGETAGGLKADGVLNRHSKRSCYGKLTFETSSGDEYTIERKRPSKLSLFKGNKDISAHTSKSTQEIINALLGFDFKTFLQTSVFGQGRNSNYASLSPKEQKEVLGRILPMEEADTWTEYTKKQIDSVKPQALEVSSKLSAVASRVSTLKEVLSQCEADGILFEKQRTQRVAESQEMLAKIKERFNPNWAKLEILQKEIEGEDVESLEARITENDILLEALTAEKQKLDPPLTAAKVSTLQWKSQLNILRAGLVRLDKAVQCPTCHRDYDETTVEAVTASVLTAEKEIEDAIAKITQCEVASTYYANEHAKVNLQCIDNVASTANLRRCLNLREEYDRDKQVLEAHVEAAEADAKSKLESAELSENPHVAVFDRTAKDLSSAEEHEQALKARNKIMQEELSHLAHWRDVYGKELKLKLFEDACPYLQARTKYHLERLRNPQLICDFSTIKRLANGDAKEEFDVTVWSETGGRGFNSLSGGEQQIVSFAIGLSLADLANRVAGSESGFLILDEPFTELDGRNSEAVVDYLMADVKNGRDTILLISNEDSLKGLIHNRIHVVKRKGISNVEL